MKMNLPFFIRKIKNEVDSLKTVSVNLPQTAYKIHIAPGLLERAGDYIAPLAGKGHVVVVSDENVWALYGNTLKTALSGAGLSQDAAVVPAGENSKSMSCLANLYDTFASANLARDGLIIAFGGGVVGDLAGYAAATWMRGVDYVQIPTTLLSQVDSSVGGKTAINLPCGKNLVGAFHQPRLVLADSQTLSTLPDKEFACGMAEVIKYGAIRSANFFEALSSPPQPLPLEDYIQTCCTIKADIVLQDERECGERKLLNFGHTLGHAVEALGGYSEYGHGQAVAIGMVLAARLGEALGITHQGTAQTLTQTLERWNLPTQCPYSLEQMMPHVALDKKRRAGGVDMVLLRNIGKAEVVPLSLEQITQKLKEAGL